MPREIGRWLLRLPLRRTHGHDRPYRHGHDRAPSLLDEYGAIGYNIICMQKQWYQIEGGARLEGTVTISGAKNAAVAIIPAAILAGETCVLENLPHIEDVHILHHILEQLGARVEFTDGDCMTINPRPINSLCATSKEVASLRGSYYLLGALLGRYGEATITLPGGCAIGARPIDQHVKGLRALGATITVDENKGLLHAEAKRLVGTEIFFDVVSVGATINLILAACRAEGQTILQNVAKEPHVVDVANFLNMAGASIKGAGTAVIRISGRKSLQVGSGSARMDGARGRRNLGVGYHQVLHLHAVVQIYLFRRMVGGDALYIITRGGD